MWNCPKVEIALFKWDLWLRSIVGQWIRDEDIKSLARHQVREQVGPILSSMGFQKSFPLALYWICCVVSDYVVDDPTSFDAIKAPAWFASLSVDRIKVRSGVRAYPPPVYNEKDIIFELKGIGVIPKNPEDWIKHYSPHENEFRLFLPSGSELYNLLKGLKGRPKLYHKRARYRIHSDRLAVKCATLKSKGYTYVEIADTFGLPKTKPYSSIQSDVARLMVKRGQKLLLRYSDNP